MRLRHESDGQTGLFVTLTYRDDELTYGSVGPTLVKSDLQKFFKRLRVHLSRKCFDSVKIRYFASGEYGPRTKRPHYHAIILGLNMSHELFVYQTWAKCDWVGYRCYPTTSPEALSYVAGYAQKKIGLNYSKHMYTLGMQPEFQLQSLGIGSKILNNPDLVKYMRDTGTLLSNGRPVPVPRYYRKKIDLDMSKFRSMFVERQNQMILELMDRYPDEIIAYHKPSQPGVVTDRTIGDYELTLDGIYRLQESRDFVDGYINNKQQNTRSKL